MSKLPKICQLSAVLIRQPLSTIKLALFSTKTVKEVAAKAPDDCKTDRKSTMTLLENLLGIRPFTASQIAHKHKNLSVISSSLLKTNHALFLQNGITGKTLVKYPDLLAETPVGEKLKAIKHLPYDVNETAPLMLISHGQFVTLMSNDPTTRISSLSRLLQVNVQQVCEFLLSKSFLRSFSLEKIEGTVNILTSFGISTQDICSDLWVLRYSSNQIKSRMTEAQEHNIETMKTWMVRAQPEIFKTYIRRRCDNRLILGDNSLAEYLSERLQCNLEMANYLIQKQPVLKNKSLKKIKDILDFLLSAGFKSYHICRVPKILAHSVETTKKRLKQLEENGLSIDSLHMLTKSQKQFTQFYEALVKSKNKLKNT